MIFGALLFTALAVWANVSDLISTERGIELGAREKNPLARWLVGNFGQWGFYGLKILVGLALAWSWFNLSVELYCVVAFAMFVLGSFATQNNENVIIRLLRRRK